MLLNQVYNAITTKPKRYERSIMRPKKTQNVYHVRVPEGRDIQKRIERISEATGKKIFAVMKETINIGLPQVERAAGIVAEK